MAPPADNLSHSDTISQRPHFPDADNRNYGSWQPHKWRIEKSALRIVAMGDVVGEDFDGHRAVETGVAGLVDFAHPTGADRGEDFIGAEFVAWGERHKRKRTQSISFFEHCSPVLNQSQRGCKL